MIQTVDEFNDNHEEETRALFAAAYEAQQEDQADDAGLQSIRESLTGYTVYNAIGAGGRGRVYCGVRESTNQSVAIKVLNGVAFSSRREMKRFWHEIAILRRLKHPGIVTVYDSGTINRAPYLVALVAQIRSSSPLSLEGRHQPTRLHEFGRPRSLHLSGTNGAASWSGLSTSRSGSAPVSSART